MRQSRNTAKQYKEEHTVPYKETVELLYTPPPLSYLLPYFVATLDLAAFPH